jgi:hypothetical protein
MRYGVLFGAMALTGCVHDEPAAQTAAAPTTISTTQPSIAQKSPPVYRKIGATNEDFQRARGRCVVQTQTLLANSLNPYTVNVRTTIQACLQADGWILVEQ